MAVYSLSGKAGTNYSITYTINTIETTIQGTLSTSIETLYTSPSPVNNRITSIQFVNITASPVTGIKLYIDGTTTAHQVCNFNIPANGSAIYKDDGTVEVMDSTGIIIVTTVVNLTGDVTSVGTVTTLATVNSNVGSFGSSTSIPSFTVNAKGLITAASGNVVIAPASTLSGNTINATVVASSLTSVGDMLIGSIGTGFVVKGVTMTLGSDALYDLYYRGASGVLTRLANGITGQILTANTGLAPSWATGVSAYLKVVGNTLSTTPAIIEDHTGTDSIMAIGTTKVYLGSTTGTGILNTPSGTTVADGIMFGDSGSLATLYRSAADTLKTDGSFIIGSAHSKSSTGYTLTPTALSGSQNSSAFVITQTWNTSGTVDLIQANLTNTASNAASHIVNFIVGGTSFFNILPTGQINSRSIIPITNNTYDSGSSSIAWKDGYYKGTLNLRKQINVATVTTDIVGLFRGMVAQTGDLVEAQDTSSNILFRVSSQGRVTGAAIPTVASANDLTLTTGNTFHISGTTTINAIINTDWGNDATITLIFDASLTVKNNTAGGAGTSRMQLNGGVDFSATVNDTLVLKWDGANTVFRELSRSIN